MAKCRAFWHRLWAIIALPAMKLIGNPDEHSWAVETLAVGPESL
jgi:hypothetical protein